ncbi:hypothetical protein LZ30DRAFT_721173 [Colletotrichum cereale]|nr:hypothetical protein LZ30DRAFT_721173 [Colletotrichum cereale]
MSEPRKRRGSILMSILREVSNPLKSRPHFLQKPAEAILGTIASIGGAFYTVKDRPRLPDRATATRQARPPVYVNV